MAKIRVEELAAQMGVGSKEVLFLLQSIGVDVKSPQAALDESTVLAILQGKTHAPKQLIVRDAETRSAQPRPKASLRRPLRRYPRRRRSRPPPAARRRPPKRKPPRKRPSRPVPPW